MKTWRFFAHSDNGQWFVKFRGDVLRGKDVVFTVSTLTAGVKIRGRAHFVEKVGKDLLVG